MPGEFDQLGAQLHATKESAVLKLSPEMSESQDTNERLERLSVLFKARANLDATNVHGESLIHDAVRQGQDWTEIVKRLLELRCNPNVYTKVGNNCVTQTCIWHQ